MKKLFLSAIAAIFCSSNFFAQGLDFTASPTSGSAPLLVTFTNTSTNPNAYKYIWYFGDGNTFTDYNTTTITHTYNVAGNYNPQFDAYDISDSLLGSVVIGSSGNISVQNVLSVSATSSNATCYNACNGTATTTINGGVAPYSYSWYPNNATSANLSGLCAGTYIVTVTDNALSQSSDTIIITEPPSLNLTITSVNITCFGSNDGSATATVTGGTPTGGTPGYAFNWTPYLGIMSYEATITNLQPGNYSVLITDANGCTTSDSVIITSPPTVLSVSTSSTTANCGLSDGSATVTANGGTSPYSYLWNTAQTSPTAASLPAGNYSCTVTDANGCTQIANANIPNTNGPTVTITSQTGVSCNGGSNGTASVFATGGTPGYTYQWNTIPAQSTPNATGLSAGNYNATVTDANGCINSATVTITQPTLLSVTTNANSFVCMGQSAFLACNPTGGAGGGYYIAWSPTTNVFCTTCPSTNVTLSTTTTYTVTITDTNSCTTTGTQTITVNPLPPVIANASATTLCAGDPVTLTGTGAISYTWLGGVSDGTSFIPTSTSSYIVTGTDTNSCTASDTVYVVVNPAPTVSAGPNQNGCLGTMINFTGSAAGATTYSWNFGDGNTSSLINPSDIYPSPGTYIVTFSATANGCSATDTALVTIGGPPAISTTSTGATCFGMCNGTVSATASGVFPPFNYVWTPGGINGSTATNLCAGTYTVTVTDINGCNSNSTVIISQPPSVSALLGGQNTICSGATTTITSTVSGGVGGPYTFLWYPGSLSTNNITVSPTSSTTYTLNVSDANGCTTSSTRAIIVNPVPTLTISGSQTICTGDSASIASSGSGGTPVYTYLWNTGSSASTITVSPGTTANYSVVCTDANGCADTAASSINVNPATTISGHIDSVGFNFLNGEVTLYKYLAAQISFDSITTVSIDVNGNYFFPTINPGLYLIKVFPDTILHPTAMPTYFGNQFLWAAADTVFHDCYANDTANISIQFQLAIPSGTGALGGIIEEGVGFGRAEGDPIPGLDVKLGKNPGGQIVASTQTNAGGYYFFGNLALNSVIGGSYTILADIPGLGMTSSYTIVLDPAHPVYDSLNYAVDSSSIYTVPTSSTGISNFTIAKENKFKVYPNPFKDNINVEYFIPAEANVKLEVFNVLGIKITSLINSKQSAGNYKYNLNCQTNQLSSGIFFMTLTIDGKSSTQRIVMMD